MRKIDGDIVVRKGETWHIKGSIMIDGKLIYSRSGDAWAHLEGEVPDATRIDEVDLEIGGHLYIDDGGCLKCSKDVTTMIAFEHVPDLPEEALSALKLHNL